MADDSVTVEVELRPHTVIQKRLDEDGIVTDYEVDLGQYQIYVKVGDDTPYRVGYVTDKGPINLYKALPYWLVTQVISSVLEMLDGPDNYRRAYYYQQGD
jgi:hypothetical protein